MVIASVSDFKRQTRACQKAAARESRVSAVIMKLDTIADLERFLLIQEQAMGATSPEVATTASKLADLYFKSGQIDKAEPLYRKALCIRQNLTGVHRSALTESEESLKKVLELREVNTRKYTHQNSQAISGAYSAASNPFNKQKPNPLLEPSTAPNNSLTRSREQCLLSGSALTLVTVGDTSRQRVTSPHLMQDAIKEAEVEIDLYKQVVGIEHATVADMLTRLADLYCRLRLYSKMEPILVEALRIREACCGSEHISVATELKNLARLYLVQERYAIAEPLFKRAILIRERVLGRDHARVADIEEQYAHLLRKTSREKLAEALERHVQKVRACSDDCVQAKQTNSIVFKSI